MGSVNKPRLCLLLPFVALVAVGYSSFCNFNTSRLPLPFPPPRPSAPASSSASSIALGGVARFLRVPQIAWGLNNQKIALARALLTARFLNRSLLLPSLSASLTYKDTTNVEPLPFDHLFSLPRFNEMCRGFVSIAKPSQLPTGASALTIVKGSGRRWTIARDLQQLVECKDSQKFARHDLLQIEGKNPFLWHDHWPVSDYARVFQCFVLVDNISLEVDRIVSKLRQTSSRLSFAEGNAKKIQKSVVPHYDHLRYVAVHMRIEKDWMIHCQKLEERARSRKGEDVNICSSKQEIMKSVSDITSLERPCLVYVAVADALLGDHTLLDGWANGLIPIEKKKLGVLHLYQKYPYLVQSAIDYEVCLQADIFVGNSFSTFSSLIVLERTLKMLELEPSSSCGGPFLSFAYNVHDSKGGPHRWVTNLSDTSLQSISYGTSHMSCEMELS